MNSVLDLPSIEVVKISASHWADRSEPGSYDRK